MINSRLVCLAVFIVLIVNSVSSMTCGRCRTEACPLYKCKYELVPDACSCCKICAKGPGEDCGGLFGLSGTCIHGYDCVSTPPADGSNYPLYPIGVCMPSKKTKENNVEP